MKKTMNYELMIKDWISSMPEELAWISWLIDNVTSFIQKEVNKQEKAAEEDVETDMEEETMEDEWVTEAEDVVEEVEWEFMPAEENLNESILKKALSV